MVRVARCTVQSVTILLSINLGVSLRDFIDLLLRNVCTFVAHMAFRTNTVHLRSSFTCFTLCANVVERSSYITLQSFSEILNAKLNNMYHFMVSDKVQMMDSVYATLNRFMGIYEWSFMIGEFSSDILNMA
jgi:hypothetical protein